MKSNIIKLLYKSGKKAAEIAKICGIPIGNVYNEIRKLRIKAYYSEPKNTVYSSEQYQLWRKAVLVRDGYHCIKCSSVKNLQVDHIKPRSLYPELAYDINNGRTLCAKCHRKTDTFGRKKIRKYVKKKKTIS